MHPKYPNIFNPIKLGPVELRNRFYAAPQSMPLNIGGKPTDDYIHYNMARAEGGCGLIFVSMASSTRGRTIQPSAHSPSHVPAFRALADAVHGAGSKIFAEPYYHWGTPGSWQALSPSAPALGPSASQFASRDTRYSSREMNKRAIKGLADALRQSVTNLREAGFDGIMLHAAHGALYEHFLSPYFNRRTDEYGGSLENRMRLLVESLEIVREAAGDRMAVGMRFNCDELLTGGYGSQEAYQVLEKIAGSGLIDFADLDVAVEPEQFWLGMSSVFIDPHPYRPYVEAVRGAAGKIPVLSVLGRMSAIADAEAMIAAGVCDMVGAARALIAEPNLARNAFEGREERSRTCIACNWCWASLPEGMQVCAINPASYRERYWRDVPPAPNRQKVVVVGGGPAGLEAARTSALRGHDVVLMDRGAELGGAFRLWAQLPGRSVFAKSIDWWEAELNRLGVDIRRNVEATSANVLAEKPDAVIVATGSVFSRSGHSSYRDLPIPGHDRDFVYRPDEILAGGARPSGKVVVLDVEGLNVGVGVAEVLALAGADVEFLTPNPSAVSSRLVNAQEAPFILKRLKAAKVKIEPTTYIKAIGDHEVTVYDIHSEEERVITNVAAVVLSTGRVSANDLERELDGKVDYLFAIGDALAVRTWTSAGFEGHRFARYIGEPGAPRTVEDIFFGADYPEFTPFPADVARPQPQPT